MLNLVLNLSANYTTKYVPELLNGVTIIRTEGSRSAKAGETGKTRQSITSVPYYSWANRGPGEMSVWMNVEK